jgi:branched-chain amino acid transport system ATP-binding protein
MSEPRMSEPRTSDLLAIEGLSAGYGEAVVLSGISLTVPEGQAVALLGRNGMGKTTLVNSIVGVTRYRGGTIRLDGRDITRLRPDQRAHAGVGWVPQERNIFKSLTVDENLTAVAQPGPWTAEKVYAMFPRLAERRRNLGNQLSGGEQQMLAVGRALMTNPRLLILDEATEGLAPLVRQEIWRCLARLKAQGQSILLIDKNVAALTRIADRHYMIERGRIVWTGSSRELAASADVQHRYLGV